jgi:hypothetical protein
MPAPADVRDEAIGPPSLPCLLSDAISWSRDPVRKAPYLVGRIDRRGERGAQNNPGLLGFGLEHGVLLSHTQTSEWPVEQHFNANLSIMPSPLLMLAVLAERTRTLRLGVAIVLLPLSHPLRVAEEIATLDVISPTTVSAHPGRLPNGRRFGSVRRTHSAMIQPKVSQW